MSECLKEIYVEQMIALATEAHQGEFNAEKLDYLRRYYRNSSDARRFAGTSCKCDDCEVDRVFTALEGA